MSEQSFLRSSIFVFLLMTAAVAFGQTQRAYRGTYQSVRQTILRIENRATAFRNNLQSWIDRNPADSQSGDDINLITRDFEESVRRLQQRFDRRQSTASDAQDVLNRAARIDVFLRRSTVDARTQNIWSSMRVDLNQLGTAYGVSWPSTSRDFPPSQNPYGNRISTRLAGTYRIDPSRSDNARDAADRAARDLAPSERRQVLESISRRLDPPDQIAIDARGRSVTIASSRAPQISFEADGRERIETTPSGRTIRTRATMNGTQLMVSTTGSGGNDFSVTLDPIDGGQRLMVTRRVYSQGLSQPVVVQSTYDRISDVAQFNVYDPGNLQSNPGYPESNGSFIVPDNTRVVAVLDDALSTRTAAVGDRFSMRVKEPREFDGATIAGHVSHIERSGRLTGRSIMTLDFDEIRLRDGRTYRFAGVVEGARSPSGEIVRVDSEGTVRDESQTKTTEERAAIGTAVGAIIGAIAGGGKGAAIGAILGAGGGAGSVYVQGRNDLDLGRGTEFTVRSGAPLNSTPR